MSSPSLRSRAAFTLVELLVVITIIGMLIALLMPAVNNARQAAQQTTCINNMRNYAVALQAYVSSKEFFPGYRLTLKQNTPAPNLKVYPSVSWQVALLPQLQRVDLYQTWQTYTDNTAQPPTMPYMEIAVCPSDNTPIGKKDPWTSYVVNGGTLDRHDTTYSDERITVPDTYSGYPMGVFQNHFYRPPPDGPQTRPIKLSLTDIRDGQGTTLMLSENLNANRYASLTTGTKDDDNTERGTCFLHWWQLPQEPAFSTLAAQPPAAGAAVAVINGDKSNPLWDPTNASWWPNVWSNGSPDVKYYSARPSSNHSGGVIISFVGGNTQFLRDDIDYQVYCHLMTPAGSKFKLVASPGQPETPLDEGAFR